MSEIKKGDLVYIAGGCCASYKARIGTPLVVDAIEYGTSSHNPCPHKNTGRHAIAMTVLPNGETVPGAFWLPYLRKIEPPGEKDTADTKQKAIA